MQIDIEQVKILWEKFKNTIREVLECYSDAIRKKLGIARV